MLTVTFLLTETETTETLSPCFAEALEEAGNVNSPLPLQSPSAEPIAFLSLPLPVHDGLGGDARLVGDGLADVFPFAEVDFECELYGSVFGLGESAVCELADELGLYARARLKNEPTF